MIASLNTGSRNCDLFDTARGTAPTIIFFDEFDSIAGRRGGYDVGSDPKDSIINQLFSELDGIEYLSDVVVLVATNHIEIIDPALRRSGRFGVEVEIPRPDREAQEEIFNVYLEGRSVVDRKFETGRRGVDWKQSPTADIACARVNPR